MLALRICLLLMFWIFLRWILWNYFLRGTQKISENQSDNHKSQIRFGELWNFEFVSSSFFFSIFFLNFMLDIFLSYWELYRVQTRENSIKNPFAIGLFTKSLVMKYAQAGKIQCDRSRGGKFPTKKKTAKLKKLKITCIM